MEYLDKDGRWIGRMVTAGVPQGLVLGPTLWNIGYDCVLEEGLDVGCCIVCYADDTLVLVKAGDVTRVVASANVQMNRLPTGFVDWALRWP